jgi:signal transduction histidine kinase
MFRVLQCVFLQHDLRLVLLAGLLCLFACVAAMSMVARARAAEGRLRMVWLVGAGTVAGCGIWATHFVAMLAYVAGFPVAYDPGLTVLSVVIAIVLCSVGFALALRPGLAALGGATTGAAIGTMHYVGMAAVRAPADAIWSPSYVISSVAIGVGLMALGMRYTIAREGWRRYLIGGLVFTVAICSMHFTGMSAVVYHFDPRVVVSGAVIDPSALAISIAAIAVLIVALGLAGAIFDHHLAARSSIEAERLRAYVTELERTRDELRKTSSDLSEALAVADEADKSKSRFLAAMSHELRTPLNAVIGFSEIMEIETFGPLGSPRYRQYAHDIHASGAHLLALINDILDLAKLDAGQGDLKNDSVDMGMLIGETLRLMMPQARAAEVALRQEVPDSLPLVTADSRRVRQILLNLLSNAVKFTLPGGSVTVRCVVDDNGLVTSVADTGIGIAAQDIARAFERFGQVDSTLARKYEGSGLGLPLAKDLAELHDGTLTLESAPNVGTTVIFTLPPNRIISMDAVGEVA